jgi:small conductance mechanosensitive channel
MDEIKSFLGAVTLANILPTVVVLLVGVLVIRAVLKLAKKSLKKSKLENAAASLILSLLKVVLYGLLGMMAASKLGIDVTGVVALASVASLALSLALQDSLSNVIGGFLLLSNHPFRSGDFVEIGGQTGTVQTIDITYTKLSTTDNKIISIPNASVLGSQIINYSSAGTRRVDIAVSAAYGSSIETVKAALLSAARVEGVIDTPAAPFAAVTGYGESAINYTLRVWTSAEKYWDVFFAVNENIQAEFDKAGVQMTYPHLNVHIDK